MKPSIFILSLLTVFAFSSCQKENVKDKKDYDKDIEICEWDGSKVADSEIWEEYIDEPILTNEDCGCIVEGVVKYVKIGTDFAYEVYYGKGECDQWAYLVTYHDGVDEEKIEKCKFKLDCDPEGN